MTNSACNPEFDPPASWEASCEQVSLETEFQRVVSQQKPEQPGLVGEVLSGHQLKPIWHRASQYLIDFLTGQPALSIRQQPTKRESQWTIYDPTTQECLSFSSEQAVRIWLENRHRSGS